MTDNVLAGLRTPSTAYFKPTIPGFQDDKTYAGLLPDLMVLHCVTFVTVTNDWS